MSEWERTSVVWSLSWQDAVAMQGAMCALTDAAHRSVWKTTVSNDPSFWSHHAARDFEDAKRLARLAGADVHASPWFVSHRWHALVCVNGGGQ